MPDVLRMVIGVPHEQRCGVSGIVAFLCAGGLCDGDRYFGLVPAVLVALRR